MSVRAVRRDLGLSPRDEANALSQHALEETLVEIFKANLALDSVAIGDDYFALGGDSINAVALISEALEWGVAIELPELFENPNIAVSAEVILTHLAEGKVTHLGEDGGFQSRRDADPGASSGDSGFEQVARKPATSRSQRGHRPSPRGFVATGLRPARRSYENRAQGVVYIHFGVDDQGWVTFTLALTACPRIRLFPVHRHPGSRRPADSHVPLREFQIRRSEATRARGPSYRGLPNGAPIKAKRPIRVAPGRLPICDR
jgi:aryl carrier-like protein